MVALQIHGVSESTRRTLSTEARARDESLQEYLLELLDREAATSTTADFLRRSRLIL